MATAHDTSSVLLRNALLSNAGFSGLTGLTTLLAAPQLAPWLGYEGGAGALRILGVGLLMFAATLLQQARAGRPDPRGAVVASAADALWVVASLALLLLAPDLLSVAGRWTVGVVAAFVALFAAAQLIGVRRMTDVRDD